MARWPSPPTPMTTAVEPSPSACRTPAVAWYEVRPAVGERRGLVGGQIADRYQVAGGWDEYVLGHPAVPAESDTVPAEVAAPVAVVVPARGAACA